jgi:hypothetical protein
MAADFDGDGKSDLAVFHPSTGEWRITPSGGGAAYVVPFGEKGDVPMPGRYDDDAKDDIVVWRPADGTWRSLSVALDGSQ